ncbi:MAG TPA: hypothetical protein VL281_12115, partial [Mycobacteriales bacterium]|nr:hypothetical protein [Mycobacteriales bacterium]
QWADDGLLDFLDHLVETIRAPLFVLTMSRPVLLERRPHWGTGRRVTSIYLEPLNDAAMGAVVDGLVGGLPDEVRTALVERAEGVPLYAVETIRALIDRDAVVPRDGRYVVAEDVASRVDLSALAAPASLTALIAARLDSLPPAERRAVQDAAVLGSAFTVEGLTAVAGGGDHTAVLDSLVRKEVLAIEADPRSPERGQYRFVQGLVRTVAYDTLGRRDRKLRHLAAAEFYAGAADADDLAGVVASHYLSAHDAAPGDPDADELTSRAATLLERAGTRAAELGSSTEGLRYLQRALELSTDTESSARIASSAATVAFAAGELAAAAELGKRSQALWTELGRLDLAGMAAGTAATAMSMRGEVMEAQALAEHALAALEGLTGTEAPTLLLILALSGCKNALGQIEQAVPYLERALSLAEVLSDWPLLVRALNHYGATHVMRGRPTVGVAVINAALAIARREHLVAADIMPLNNLTALQLYRDLPAARSAGEEGLASARRHGERTLGGWLACNLSFAMWFDGSWDDIDRLVEEGAAGTGAATFHEDITLLSQALARTARGEAVHGEGLAAQLDAEDVSFRAMAELERGIAALSQGRLEEAAELTIKSADTFFGFVGIEDDYPLFWIPAVELALETGRLAEAQRLLATVADAPQALVPPYLRAQLHRLRALVAIAEQDDTAAEPDLVQAIEGLRSYGAPFYTARAQLELAELLSRAGRSNEARPQAEAAHEVFSRLRATPWAERAAAVASLAAV